MSIVFTRHAPHPCNYFVKPILCCGRQVFTTLALVNITQLTMGKFLYMAVQTSSESWVSIKRIETILLMEVSGRCPTMHLMALCGSLEGEVLASPRLTSDMTTIKR